MNCSPLLVPCGRRAVPQLADKSLLPGLGLGQAPHVIGETREREDIDSSPAVPEKCEGEQKTKAFTQTHRHTDAQTRRHTDRHTRQTHTQTHRPCLNRVLGIERLPSLLPPCCSWQLRLQQGLERSVELMPHELDKPVKLNRCSNPILSAEIVRVCGVLRVLLEKVHLSQLCPIQEPTAGYVVKVKDCLRPAGGADAPRSEVRTVVMEVFEAQLLCRNLLKPTEP